MPSPARRRHRARTRRPGRGRRPQPRLHKATDRCIYPQGYQNFCRRNHRSRLSMGVSEATTPMPSTVLIGLIGASIQASRSPALHMREGMAQGLAYIYRLIDLEVLGLATDALPELIGAARRFRFTGLNITHPCKQSVIPLLDELSADARAIGAVNTVVFAADGRTAGHNTDWSGFAESFRRELDDAPR